MANSSQLHSKFWHGYKKPDHIGVVWPAGAMYFGALTTLVGGIAALLAYESFALGTGHEPITWKARRFSKFHPGVVGLIAFSVGALAGHLLWYEPDSEVPKQGEGPV